jgi:hypothetical protein
MKIKIDDEIADKIVVKNLIRAYRSLLEEMARLESRMHSGEVLPGHQMEDYENFVDTSDGILSTLKYFMVHTDFEKMVAKVRKGIHYDKE